MKKKLVIISFIMLFLLCGCSSKKEKLILATEAGFAPYEYYDDGEIVGVDIEICEIIEVNNKN